jgi:putative SOS response-associated peptidase YedK
VHFKDEQPLVFAALYDSWEDAEGEVLYTFTILTTRVSKQLEWLHGEHTFFNKELLIAALECHGYFSH